MLVKKYHRKFCRKWVNFESCKTKIICTFFVKSCLVFLPALMTKQCASQGTLKPCVCPQFAHWMQDTEDDTIPSLRSLHCKRGYTKYTDRYRGKLIFLDRTFFCNLSHIWCPYIHTAKLNIVGKMLVSLHASVICGITGK